MMSSYHHHKDKSVKVGKFTLVTKTRRFPFCGLGCFGKRTTNCMTRQRGDVFWMLFASVYIITYWNVARIIDMKEVLMNPGFF